MVCIKFERQREYYFMTHKNLAFCLNPDLSKVKNGNPSNRELETYFGQKMNEFASKYYFE
jgi:hypothetical protein